MKRKMAATGSGSVADFEFEEEEEEDLISEGAGEANYSTSCTSILVCTGIYTNSHSASQRNHRDFVLDPELVKPKYTTANVLESVQLVLEKEKFLWWLCVFKCQEFFCFIVLDISRTLFILHIYSTFLLLIFISLSFLCC